VSTRLAETLENTIVVLIGFAGTGKYTIGRELCRRTGAKLIDNHLIANPVFKVVNADGVTPLPSEVWDKIKQIRRTVYEAIRELSPPKMSFVFTVEWRANNPGDHKAFVDLEELATARQSLFVPIRLICEVDELCRRVVQPARVEMLKEISPELARKKSAEDSVLNPQHPNLRTIDVTRKSPAESVEVILDEVNLIRGSNV
jgi:hypothetical protein